MQTQTAAGCICLLCAAMQHVGNTHTCTHAQTSAASYPSLAVRQKSSPSWHSSTVVKPCSSTVCTGDTRGGAAGGEQLPQHSPSAEPSARLLASRAKPGWGRVPKPSGVPGVKPGDQEVDVHLVFS